MDALGEILGRVKFSHFWNTFDKRKNFFTKMLEGVDAPWKHDLHFFSVFRPGPLALLSRFRKSHRRFRKSKAKRIWFSGENQRVPFPNDYDLTISFDQDDYGGKNFYFPLFYMEALFSDAEADARRGIPINQVDLTRSRSWPSENKTGFVCAFINNPHPVRLRAIEQLRRFGSVDVYGKHSGLEVESKYEIAKNYKFMLAFENDLYPGYVTEKLLDAYACGTVPLYWGNLGSEGAINRKSFINAGDYSTLSEFAEAVARMTELDYLEVFREPLLVNALSAEELISALLE